MTTARKSIVTLSLGMIVATSLTGFAAAQGGPAMPGPTGAPKVTPPIVVPDNTPAVGGPVVLPPTPVSPPPVRRGAREALQGRVAREVAIPKLNLVPRCERTNSTSFPLGPVRSFASVQGTIQGNLREEINSRLVITGACFGDRNLEPFGGLLVRLVRGDGTEVEFFKYTPRGFTSSSILEVKSWSWNRIEFTVAPLINKTSLPVAPSETLKFELLTLYGRYVGILTQTDIDKLDRDGSVAFPPLP